MILRDGQVGIEIASIRIEVVVDLGQPWLVEDPIRHGASVPHQGDSWRSSSHSEARAPTYARARLRRMTRWFLMVAALRVSAPASTGRSQGRPAHLWNARVMDIAGTGERR